MRGGLAIPIEPPPGNSMLLLTIDPCLDYLFGLIITAPESIDYPALGKDIVQFSVDLIL